jgi:hypothetical protein
MVNNELISMLDNINNKDDFSKFIKLLEIDFKENENTWENITIADFLESL